MSTAPSPLPREKIRKVFEFELRFQFSPELSEFSDEMVDALYESGCGDGLVGMTCGIPYIAFSRRAPSFRVALLSAIADVERADVGLTLIGVEMQAAGSSEASE